MTARPRAARTLAGGRAEWNARAPGDFDMLPILAATVAITITVLALFDAQSDGAKG